MQKIILWSAQQVPKPWMLFSVQGETTPLVFCWGAVSSSQLSENPSLRSVHAGSTVRGRVSFLHQQQCNLCHLFGLSQLLGSLDFPRLMQTRLWSLSTAQVIPNRTGADLQK